VKLAVADDGITSSFERSWIGTRTELRREIRRGGHNSEVLAGRWFCVNASRITPVEIQFLYSEFEKSRGDGQSDSCLGQPRVDSALDLREVKRPAEEAEMDR
jgi:hypothetical protein